MLYLFNIQKHICTNPLCEDFRPPRKKREDGEGGQRRDRRPQKKGNGEGFRSGKPIKTQSGADRFKQRYAKKPEVIATAAPTEQKIIKDKDGSEKKITVKKQFSTSVGTWDALDALKLGGEAEAPKEEVKETVTPEPAPAEPVPAPEVPAPAEAPAPENPAHVETGNGEPAAGGQA